MSCQLLQPGTNSGNPPESTGRRCDTDSNDEQTSVGNSDCVQSDLQSKSRKNRSITDPIFRSNVDQGSDVVGPLRRHPPPFPLPGSVGQHKTGVVKTGVVNKKRTNSQSGDTRKSDPKIRRLEKTDSTAVESDSCENPKYRLFIQTEEKKKKKRICAALSSCLPPNTTDEQKMRVYNVSVSCFQRSKGLDGAEFEKTVQVPPSFDKIIGLQSQVTVNNGLVDTVNNDGREDFVPYLIANGPFKHGDHVPVIISHKVSLRERWKQDEGVAQHSRVFLITLAGLKTYDVSVQKLKKARAHNIHIVVPNLSEFQDNRFVTNKRPLCLTESQMWTQIHSCLSATNLNLDKK